ncbi:hypothetical protein GCM10027277_56780 [Pseudoduganella ginsengisoli]|uniref:Energy transducer TonB n=1 Tax=Pseudoduganella ginsengisoli TaxID=1462440 RepID=A0A6L6Q3D5_9BURK|nr:M56 family metallopeptidase [Pseudoduganella ginsengisoli]MTW03949.1 energy transducer TonB [Pseudoduganella ginsengisoli]
MEHACQTLAALSAALAAATLLVLALRPVLRKVCGAGVVYAAWLLIPLMLAAVLLPRAPQQAVVIMAAPPASATVVIDTIVMPLAAPRVPGAAWITLWMAGSALSLAMMALQHRRFVRSLGALLPAGDADVYRAASDRAGPALVGVLRPRIVLPHDFTVRYTPQEQALILAHERVHAQRGDALANALAGLLLALFWFHPLAHAAIRCFRLDQELACDAAVLDAFPGARRCYADAILKTQLASSGQAFACTWQSTHPLKGRIMSIARPPVAQPVRAAGLCALAMGIAASCTAAWALAPQSDAAAAQPAVASKAPVTVAPGAKPVAPAPKKADAALALAAAAAAPRPAPAATPASSAPAPRPQAAEADRVDVNIQLKVNDSREQSIVMKGVGLGDNTANFSSGEAADRCDYEFRALPAAGGSEFYQISAVVRCANKPPSNPRMVAKLGQPSRMRAGEVKGGNFEGFDMTVMVSKAE